MKAYAAGFGILLAEDEAGERDVLMMDDLPYCVSNRGLAEELSAMLLGSEVVELEYVGPSGEELEGA